MEEMRVLCYLHAREVGFEMVLLVTYSVSHWIPLAPITA